MFFLYKLLCRYIIIPGVGARAAPVGLSQHRAAMNLRDNGSVYANAAFGGKK